MREIESQGAEGSIPRRKSDRSESETLDNDSLQIDKLDSEKRRRLISQSAESWEHRAVETRAESWKRKSSKVVLKAGL